MIKPWSYRQYISWSIILFQIIQDFSCRFLIDRDMNLTHQTFHQFSKFWLSIVVNWANFWLQVLQFSVVTIYNTTKVYNFSIQLFWNQNRTLSIKSIPTDATTKVAKKDFFLNIPAKIFAQTLLAWYAWSWK